MTCQPYIGAANEHALDPGHRYLEELEMDGLLEFAPRSERSETGAARRWAATQSTRRKGRRRASHACDF